MKSNPVRTSGPLGGLNRAFRPKTRNKLGGESEATDNEVDHTGI